MEMLMNFVYQYGDVVQFFIWVFHYTAIAVAAIVAVIWWVRVAKKMTSGECCGNHGGHHGHGHHGHGHHAGHKGHPHGAHHASPAAPMGSAGNEVRVADAGEPVDVTKFVD